MENTPNQHPFRGIWKALTPAQRTEVGALIGRDTGHLRNVSYGFRAVKPEVAIAVEAVTLGAVPVEQTLPTARWMRLKDRRYKHHASGRPVVLLAREPA